MKQKQKSPVNTGISESNNKKVRLMDSSGYGNLT